MSTRGRPPSSVRATASDGAGVVVNERPNVDRRQHDPLKATLHNAARQGPAGENRAGVPAFRDHLRGRIAWVHHLNPARGERLLSTFARIDWEY